MPGAYKTLDDLIREVLSLIGVLATGQPPDPEDYQYVQNGIDSVLRKIAALELVYIPDPNNIPGEFFQDVAAIAAGELQAKWGLPPDEFAKLVTRGLGGVQGTDVGAGAAALSLKLMTRGKPTYERLRVEYL